MKTRLLCFVTLLLSAISLPAQNIIPKVNAFGANGIAQNIGIDKDAKSLIFYKSGNNAQLTRFWPERQLEESITIPGARTYLAELRQGRFVVFKDYKDAIDFLYYDLKSRTAHSLSDNHSSTYLKICPNSFDYSNRFLVAYHQNAEYGIQTDDNGQVTATIYDLSTGESKRELHLGLLDINKAQKSYATVIDCSFDFESQLLAQIVVEPDSVRGQYLQLHIADIKHAQDNVLDLANNNLDYAHDDVHVKVIDNQVRVLILCRSQHCYAYQTFSQINGVWIPSSITKYYRDDLAINYYNPQFNDSWTQLVMTSFSDIQLDHGLRRVFKHNIFNLERESVQSFNDTLSACVYLADVRFCSDTAYMCYANGTEYHESAIWLKTSQQQSPIRCYPPGQCTEYCTLHFVSKNGESYLRSINSLGHALLWKLDSTLAFSSQQMDYAPRRNFSGISNYDASITMALDIDGLKSVPNGTTLYKCTQTSNASAFTATGDTVINAHDYGITLVSTTNFQEFKIFDTPGGVRKMACNAKAHAVASAGEYLNEVCFLDLHSGQIMSVPGPSYNMISIALSSTAASMAVADPHQIIVWNTNSTTAKCTIRLDSIWDMAFCSNERYLLVSADSSLYIFDCVENKKISNWCQGKSPITHFRVSLDYEWIAAIASDGSIYLWRLEQFNDPNIVHAGEADTSVTAVSQELCISNSDICSLSVPQGNASLASTKVYDLQGNFVSTTKSTGSDNRLQLDLHALAVGRYIAVIDEGSQRLVRQLLVLR